MKHKITENQRGYLLIIVVILTVVIGLVSAMLVNMYLGAMRSTTNILQADQALYIAKSGLEIAKHDLLKTTALITCESINANPGYNKTCYPPPENSNCLGIFSVKGEEKNLTTYLAGFIGNQATVLNLSNNPGLLDEGMVMIDNEVIWYSKVEGVQLLNLRRGIFGSNAADHNAGTTVTQNVCVLISEASVPNLDRPEGKRVLQEILWKSTNSGANGSINGMRPALAAVGQVNLGSTSSVRNFTITDPTISGSTIVSGRSVSISGNGKTLIGPSPGKAGSPVNGKAQADIKENATLSPAILWDSFFNQSKDELKKESADKGKVVTNCNNYNFANASGTIWLDCNFSPSGTIGTNDHPVTLIVSGNFTTSPGVTMYGVIYVVGNVEINGSMIYGQMAVEGTVNFKGNPTIEYRSYMPASYTNSSITSEIFN